MDFENYYIKPISKNMARKMIVDNHYSHLWTKCSVAFGVFQRGLENAFFDTFDDVLLGCVVFGDPIGVDVVNSISPLVGQGSVWELTRLWIQDGTPKNIESWAIAQSLSYIKKEYPNIKVIISYADPEFNHRGIVYQASNFLFQEVGIDVKRWMLSFSDNPYKWHHPKTIMDKYDCNGVKDLKEKMPKPFWLKTTGRKFRYIYITAGKTEKKKIFNTLKHPAKAYPKDIRNQDILNEIKKYE